jgi:transposase-like protein
MNKGRRHLIDEQELITVAEAARRFGKSPNVIRNWIYRRAITSYKPDIGIRVYVDAKEIEEKTALKERPAREE